MNKKKKKTYMFFAGVAILLCIKIGYDMWEISFRGIDKATQILFSDRYWNLWSEQENITFSFNRDCGSTTAQFHDIEMKVFIRTKNGFISAEECRMDGDEQVYFIKKITGSKSARYYPSKPNKIYVIGYRGDYIIYPDKKVTINDEVQELNDNDYQLIDFFHTAEVQFRLLLGNVRNEVLKVRAVMLILFIALSVVFLKIAGVKEKQDPEYKNHDI